jgi:hypothetical protein
MLQGQTFLLQFLSKVRAADKQKMGLIHFVVKTKPNYTSKEEIEQQEDHSNFIDQESPPNCQVRD